MKVITQARTERGWSKSELARRADMNSATVCQIENGRMNPYPGQVQKLARALGVPAERLLEDAHELQTA